MYAFCFVFDIFDVIDILLYITLSCLHNIVSGHPVLLFIIKDVQMFKWSPPTITA